MRLALNQARKHLGNTRVNPSVGCVITKENSVISVGCTDTKGRPHAEHNAIMSCKTRPKNLEMYVTLEPCSHYGFTPPCAEKIIKSKLKKVFFSINDPDRRSYNKCTKLLSENKIIVKKGIYSNKVNLFYRSYLKYKKSSLPFVTSKLAVSKDYFTINKKGEWITNYFSRSRGHLIRSQHDCILTSSKTINDDDPSLNCRIRGLGNFSPKRIIFPGPFRLNLGLGHNQSRLLRARDPSDAHQY